MLSIRNHKSNQRAFAFIIIIMITFSLSAQSTWLTKREIQEDLNYLTQVLKEKSSYIYLNGYDFTQDFNSFSESFKDSIHKRRFTRFLNNTLGKIGDRHLSRSSIRGYNVDENYFLPFKYAPLNGRVVVLTRDEGKNLKLLHPKFPYLKKIQDVHIDQILKLIRPIDKTAPKETYHTLSTRDVRDISKYLSLIGVFESKKIRLTLTEKTKKRDTTLLVDLVSRKNRMRPWDEKFESEYLLLKDKDYNDPRVFKKLFQLIGDIPYIKLPSMVSKDDAPLFYQSMDTFMNSVKNKRHDLIVDVRANRGGTRDLLYKFAKYVVHPDSIYVVNAVKQRSDTSLTARQIKRLHNRFLFSMDQLEPSEQRIAKTFLKSFRPMYELRSDKFSPYYFALLNGQKISDSKSHYHGHVYILTNEKTFSAASVFVSSLKGLPNITIVGITSDGSSGNSEWFDLPNSKLFGKVSTMVSFQKNGKILDGFGTEPDVMIERDMNQILWKSDSQLNKLIQYIKTKK